MSFFDRREVRDILAYFKVISCPQDEVSLLRILNTPPRGISASAVRNLTDCAVQRGKTLWDVLPDVANIPGLRPSASQAVDAFYRQVQGFQSAFRRPRSLVDTASRMIEAVGYRDDLKQRYPDPNEQESRWNAVEQIVNAIGSYEAQTSKATLEGFLDATLLDHRSDDDKEAQLRQNSITLMTLHSAKGLEFPHVYLVGLEEGLLPHRRSVDSGDESQIEEERRLCYVGVTRAQDRLTISLALSRRKWGKARDSIPSRFLYELTGQADHPNAANARQRQLVSQPGKPNRGSRARATRQ
jgi:DNA helicase-2/ATP-dependent DNA helicase PcrA